LGEIYFVRHGQASYGTANYDRLSPLGHQQAEWLGAHLAETVAGGFDMIVSGTLQRHRETLGGILKSLPFEGASEDARLNEMSFFQMEQAYAALTGNEAPDGQSDMADHFRRVLAHWEQDLIPDVPESYSHFRARVTGALFHHAAHGARVLLVSSGGPIGIALSHVLRLDLHAMADVILHTHNASYSRFVVFPDRLELAQFNAISHLETPDRHHAKTYL